MPGSATSVYGLNPGFWRRRWGTFRNRCGKRRRNCPRQNGFARLNQGTGTKLLRYAPCQYVVREFVEVLSLKLLVVRSK
jgi:hypothetical protein